MDLEFYSDLTFVFPRELESRAQQIVWDTKRLFHGMTAHLRDQIRAQMPYETGTAKRSWGSTADGGTWVEGEDGLEIEMGGIFYIEYLNKAGSYHWHPGTGADLRTKRPYEEDWIGKLAEDGIAQFEVKVAERIHDHMRDLGLRGGGALPAGAPRLTAGG